MLWLLVRSQVRLNDGPADFRIWQMAGVTTPGFSLSRTSPLHIIGPVLQQIFGFRSEVKIYLYLVCQSHLDSSILLILYVEMLRHGTATRHSLVDLTLPDRRDMTQLPTIIFPL